MKVSTTQTVDFDIKTRYIKTITDDPSETEADKLRRKFEFLREVFDGMFSGLLNCGPQAFDTLKMAHNGRSWVIYLESEVFK